jgi:hypothetical protein
MYASAIYMQRVLLIGPAATSSTFQNMKRIECLSWQPSLLFSHIHEILTYDPDPVSLISPCQRPTLNLRNMSLLDVDMDG